MRRLLSWLRGRSDDDTGPLSDRDAAYLAAVRVEELLAVAPHPEQLLGEQDFEAGVDLLLGERYWHEELLRYGRGANVALGCLALEALARRRPERGIVAGLLAALATLFDERRYFLLRAIDGQARGSVLPRVLARVDETWLGYPSIDALREFVARRLAEGDALTVVAMSPRVPDERRESFVALVRELADVLPPEVVAEFEQWRVSAINRDFLSGIGRIWPVVEARTEEQLVITDELRDRLADAEAALAGEPGRSVLVVGEPGVGKAATASLLAQALQRREFLLFEASPAAVLAGQVYIGQLEGRVQELVRELGGKPAVWYMPEFAESVWAGRHQNNPRSLLDLVLPHVESGRLRLLGVLEPRPYERLVELAPRARTAFHVVRLEPLDDEQTLEAARKWRHEKGAAISDEVLREALQLAKQYLRERELPGALIRLLEETHARDRRRGRADTIGVDELLSTVSALTGLPLAILDDRVSLDRTELRTFFETRVLGQPEAVDCLCERIAMVKAGLTDPTRPLGVFLFVGPTGTGKTEIAKTLASYLFGSPDRLIRLDMSEFQTSDSLVRILGDPATGRVTSLVEEVRRQPFSVVLLDEIEKAHPNVWDVFLQIFDDGRLTDAAGNTADFRHCVLIMTSNLGARIETPLGFGVAGAEPEAGAAGVSRAVATTFRPEFLNRIDRTVVFRPLTRATLREIIEKELREALNRRGLRVRSWAVEWDESAIDFLLEKGYTRDLGARPLRRAVERHLLAPLANAIVDHQVPEGDQFLFLRRSGDRLEVRFVDPDADEAPAAEAALPADERQSVESVALAAHGTTAELAYLERAFADLRARIENDEWRRAKQVALDATRIAGFWESPDRFAVLGRAEYMDRIEQGLRTAERLRDRLKSTASNGRNRLPAELVARLAEQLYLVEAAADGVDAGLPRDAFVLVEAVEPERDAGAFAARIGEMYKRWAAKRRMQAAVIDETPPPAYRLLLAVSGFGAYPILKSEAGLHVLEEPGEDGRQLTRIRVRVRVAPQPEGERDGRDARGAAERALEHRDDDSDRILRRYRERPSPLVRDSVGGWRSGKVDQVLRGEFDLIGASLRR